MAQDWINRENGKKVSGKIYDCVRLMARKASTNVQQVHLVAQTLAIAKGLGRNSNCLAEDIVVKAALADVKSCAANVQAKLTSFSE